MYNDHIHAGMLSLWQAVLIDVGSLLVVVGNGSIVLFNTSFAESDIPEEPSRKQGIEKVTYVPPLSPLREQQQQQKGQQREVPRREDFHSL